MASEDPTQVSRVCLYQLSLLAHKPVDAFRERGGGGGRERTELGMGLETSKPAPNDVSSPKAAPPNLSQNSSNN